MRWKIVAAFLAFFVCSLTLCSKSRFWEIYYRIKYFTSSMPVRILTAASVNKMVNRNLLYNHDYAVLVNMALPSSTERMRVIDLRRKVTVFETRTMHGKASGGTWATKFSNHFGSNKTALGRYVIVEEYRGHFGEAYRLAGIDATNSNAYSRSIVLHQSSSVRNNTIGRSKGCPAVSQQALASIKPYLRVGTLVWLYR